jgi:hypothetical protein
MDGANWKDDDQLSWRATPYQAPVLDSEQNQIGTAESLLGDENADIFHGLAVKLSHHGRLVEVPADQIARITLAAIHTNVKPSEVDGLEPYTEERWFHLGWGGLFRSRPEWKQE